MTADPHPPAPTTGVTADGPDRDVCWLTIAELGRLLARRALSPVELCRQLISRCERMNQRLNAFLDLRPDTILDQARAAEAEFARGRVRGPLHGVPVAVKDNIDVRGHPTTAGTTIWRHAVARQDAAVVARLRSAGAIIFGKTNLPELAYGPVDTYHYGPSRNPWDLERYAGGSSMGSAAAVAAGLVPAAIGTDTTGSIRNPAAWSGVVGLKATHGLVPGQGVIPLAPSMDHVGPMARTAQDAALLFDVIAADQLSSTAGPAAASRPVVAHDQRGLDRRVDNLRIGVLRDLFTSLAADLASTIGTALQVLQDLGGTLTDVAVRGWDAAAQASDILVACEAATQHRTLIREHGHELLPQVRTRLEQGLATPAPDYIEAQRVAARLRAQLAQVFNRVDLLALPTRESTAPRIDDHGRRLDSGSGPRHVVAANIAGLPAISVPCGFDQHHLPVGLQLIGPAWCEPRLLALADAFQQATAWHTHRPAPCQPSSFEL